MCVFPIGSQLPAPVLILFPSAEINFGPPLGLALGLFRLFARANNTNTNIIITNKTKGSLSITFSSAYVCVCVCVLNIVEICVRIFVHLLNNNCSSDMHVVSQMNDIISRRNNKKLSTEVSHHHEVLIHFGIIK